MPKKSRDFPEQLSILTVEGTHEYLIAIGYYMGNGGAYAAVARNFVDGGIRNFIESLSLKDKKRFDEILENVRVRKVLDHSAVGSEL